MPISLSPQMMRQIIMEHYDNPTFKHKPESNIEKYESINMNSSNCIDDITIYLLNDIGTIETTTQEVNNIDSIDGSVINGDNTEFIRSWDNYCCRF